MKRSGERNRDRLDLARRVRDEVAGDMLKTDNYEDKEDLRAVWRMLDDKVKALEERRDRVRVAARGVAETAVVPLRAVSLNVPADTIVQVAERIAVEVYDLARATEEKRRAVADVTETAEARGGDTASIEAPSS